MDASLKVTDQPQEFAFVDILAGDNVLNIPLFQRSYKWDSNNLKELQADLNDIIEGRSPSQFLGVLVLVPHPRSIGQPSLYDLVDGQQRVTTIYLYILAAAKVAAEKGSPDWALRLLRSLLFHEVQGIPYNTRLVPASSDRHQFKSIWDSFSSVKSLQDDAVWKRMGQSRPLPPAPAGKASGPMITQFARLVSRCSETFELLGANGLEQLVKVLTEKLGFIQLSLRDPSLAPRIFERLNSRGQKITTSDLVRNEIFARVGNDAARARAIFEADWEPFVASLSNHDASLENLLFPYGLSIDPTITKATLFSTLRSRWNSLDTPQLIIADLNRFVPTYLALEKGVCSESWSREVQNGLRRLWELGAPSSTYSFLFQLLDAYSKNEITETRVIEVTDVLESFLFRRAICGYEPTGLHAVFKGMWQEIKLKSGDVSRNAISLSIGSRSTVPWPSDIEFAENIKSGNLYGRNVKNFALMEYDRSIPEESPLDLFEIEHILPQTAGESWRESFGTNWQSVLHTWANLTPISRGMNPGAGAKSFELKAGYYKKSKFPTTRMIAEKYTDWTPEQLQDRAQKLADWAIARWPYTVEPT